MPRVQRLCEFRRDNDTLCGDRADWLVRVGTRTSDEQLACSLHLAETCLAMYEAEDRRGAVLSLITP